MLQRIQVLRAVGALMVLFLHGGFLLQHTPLHALPEFIWHIGFAGVDIFFVISGFILAYTMKASDREQPVFFLFRCWLRLYTGYLPAIILTFGIFWAVGRSLEPYHAVPALLLIPQDLRTTPLPLAWTLYHELYFYLVFTLLLLVGLRRRLLLLIAYGAMILYFQVTYYAQGYYTAATWLEMPTNKNVVWFYVVSPYILEFISGVLLFDGIRRINRPGLWLAMGLLLMAIGWMADAYLVPGGLMTGVHTAQRVFFLWPPAFFLVGWAASSDLRKKPLGWPRHLMPLGGASYALFLIHLPLLKGLNSIIHYPALAFIPNSPTLMFLIACLFFPAAIGLSFLWLRKIELPLYKAALAATVGDAKR